MTSIDRVFVCNAHALLHLGKPLAVTYNRGPGLMTSAVSPLLAEVEKSRRLEMLGDGQRVDDSFLEGAHGMS